MGLRPCAPVIILSPTEHSAHLPSFQVKGRTPNPWFDPTLVSDVSLHLRPNCNEFHSINFSTALFTSAPLPSRLESI